MASVSARFRFPIERLVEQLAARDFLEVRPIDINAPDAARGYSRRSARPFAEEKIQDLAVVRKNGTSVGRPGRSDSAFARAIRVDRPELLVLLELSTDEDELPSIG